MSSDKIFDEKVKDSNFQKFGYSTAAVPFWNKTLPLFLSGSSLKHISMFAEQLLAA